MTPEPSEACLSVYPSSEVQPSSPDAVEDYEAWETGISMKDLAALRSEREDVPRSYDPDDAMDVLASDDVPEGTIIFLYLLGR